MSDTIVTIQPKIQTLTTSQQQILLVDNKQVQLVTAGTQGPAGQGIASGGTVGQLLRKKSATNYDTEWTDYSYAISSISAPATFINKTPNTIWYIPYTNITAYVDTLGIRQYTYGGQLGYTNVGTSLVSFNNCSGAFLLANLKDGVVYLRGYPPTFLGPLLNDYVKADLTDIGLGSVSGQTWFVPGSMTALQLTAHCLFTYAAYFQAPITPTIPPVNFARRGNAEINYPGVFLSGGVFENKALLGEFLRYCAFWLQLCADSGVYSQPFGSTSSGDFLAEAGYYIDRLIGAIS